jgi:hypothetical protein
MLLILGLLSAVGPAAADIKLKQIMLDNGVKLEYRVTGPKDGINGARPRFHVWFRVEANPYTKPLLCPHTDYVAHHSAGFNRSLILSSISA